MTKFLLKYKICSLFLIFECSNLFFMQAMPQEVSVIHTPRSAGLGGAVSSTPIGVETLLYNPAGIVLKMPGKNYSGNIMVLADGYFQPKYLFPILSDVADVKNTSGQLLLNAKNLITSSGTGASFVVTSSYTGDNFGLGLFSSMSIFLNGEPFPLGTEGFVKVSFTLPLAYGLKLFENKKIQIAAGVSLNPSVLIYRILNGSDVDALVGGSVGIGELISDSIRHPYVGMPCSLGIIASIYDIPYKNAQLRFSSVAKNLFADYFVPGLNMNPIENDLAFQVGSALILPFEILNIDFYGVLSAEVHSLNILMSGGISFWEQLRLGAEFVAGQLLRFQLGLCGGYPCIGGEITLLHFSLGCSWQTVETGTYLGDNPLSIFKISAAVKL